MERAIVNMGQRVVGMISVVLALAVPGWGLTGNAAATANVASGRLVVPDTRPAWVSAATDIGTADATKPVDARVYLAGRDPVGLTRYARAVSDPASADFRRYLSPKEFGERYGPTPRQLNAVTAWIGEAGLHITEVTSHYVAVHGSLAATENAFGVHLHNYRTPERMWRAPDSDVNVPAEVAPAVLTVTGLTTDPAPETHTPSAPTVPSPPPVPPAAPTAAAALAKTDQTCSAYYGQKPATDRPPAYGHPLNYTGCGYEPNQLHSAYGVDRSGLTGRGVTVAVVVLGASPTIASDTDTFFSRHGLPRFKPEQFTQNLPPGAGICPASGNWGEETLDIESVHTMAPDANIAYVSAGCATWVSTELLDAETRIVDNHLASIVTNSWGSLGTEARTTPDAVTAWERIFQQGAIEGTGFYFASGDEGDDSETTADHRPAVEFPQSDPWVTSVGGTSLAIDQRGTYQWETGWGSLAARLSADGKNWTALPGRFDGGSGGGVSTRFTQPFYQRGIVPNALSHSAGAGATMRVVPDIAADADLYTGMLVGKTSTSGPIQYRESPIGGTSLSSPLIAGIQADAQEAQHGVPIGFANPAIYARYHTGVYHDVTDEPLGPGVPIAAAHSVVIPDTGTAINRAITFGRDTSLHATPGYDDVTGVGTPTRAYLDSYRREKALWP